MRFSLRLIAILAVAALLTPALHLHAQQMANVSADTTDVWFQTKSIPTHALSSSAFAPAAAPTYWKENNSDTPRVELFVGYSYLRDIPMFSSGNRLLWLNGGSTSVAFNLNKHLGIVGDFAGFDDSRLRLTGTTATQVVNSSGTVFTYLGGPRLTFLRPNRVTPFAQVLFGGVHASPVTLATGCTGAGCTPLPTQNSFAMTAGGGVDITVSRHIAIRAIQAEYMMTRFEVLTTAQSAAQNDVRLSSGIVFRFSSSKPSPAVTYSCAASPTTVFPGDPVVITGSAENLDPKKPVVYSWTSTAGVAPGNTNTTTVSSKTPGSYTVSGHVSEGPKPGQSADCSPVSFMVRDYDPPTISCSANPSTLNPGDSSIITAAAMSPQNRPLTYSYSTTMGSLTGTGATTTFSSSGAPAGTATISCNVVDDLGKSATATTSVNILAPPVAALPMTKSLCTIGFDRDKNRPTRVNNESKACLDDIALTLQQDSSARLALVGNDSVAEAKQQHTAWDAAERAANTKDYLVTDKGIDASRIVLYTGSTDAETVTTTLIPTGATLDTTNLTVVDESKVKARHRN